jgi:hypothetical protein
VTYREAIDKAAVNCLRSAWDQSGHRSVEAAQIAGVSRAHWFWLLNKHGLELTRKVPQRGRRGTWDEA